MVAPKYVPIVLAPSSLWNGPVLGLFTITILLLLLLMLAILRWSPNPKASERLTCQRNNWPKLIKPIGALADRSLSDARNSRRIRLSVNCTNVIFLKNKKYNWCLWDVHSRVSNLKVEKQRLPKTATVLSRKLFNSLKYYCFVRNKILLRFPFLNVSTPLCTAVADSGSILSFNWKHD